MKSLAQKKLLRNICLGVFLSVVSLSASAMCFYNKMNPSDFAPEGYNLSQDDKTVVFNFGHDGIHFYYNKSVGLNQHQCIGDGGASVAIALMGLGPWEASTQHVDPHGYVVVETEPSDLSTAYAKYFKVNMKVYSQSNSIQNTFTQNIRCTVDGSFLGCSTI